MGGGLPAMNIARNVVAIDFGAESGRLVLCHWNGNEGTLEEVHRFPNAPQEIENHRSEEHTSELQSLRHLVCPLPLEKSTQDSGSTFRPLVSTSSLPPQSSSCQR